MDNRRQQAQFGPRSPLARMLTFVALMLLLCGVGFLIFFYFGPIYSLSTFAPVQPLPFSHKLHAGDLGVDCQFCHIFARRSEIAGVPSLGKCMGCHGNLTIDSPAIKTLVKLSESEKPIEWVRIYHLPDHVWFSHKRHIKRDIACQQCHGPVETLNVNAQMVIHRMGFCLECHQKHKAPTDCWTCHT